MDAIGEAFARLNRRDVGVHQHGGDPLFFKGLDRLRSGVVELSSLADLERAGAEDKDTPRLLGEIGAVHDQLLARGSACGVSSDADERDPSFEGPFIAPQRRRKSSKRYPASLGPGVASG